MNKKPAKLLLETQKIIVQTLISERAGLVVNDQTIPKPSKSRLLFTVEETGQ